jgi:hypothetical protein
MAPEILTDTVRLELHYRAVAAPADYLQIVRNAKAGPLGRSDYRIALAAMALPLMSNWRNIGSEDGAGVIDCGDLLCRKLETSRKSWRRLPPVNF